VGLALVHHIISTIGKSCFRHQASALTSEAMIPEQMAVWIFWGIYRGESPAGGLVQSATMSSSVPTAIPQLDLGNTFGALFIGVILAAV
jgi:hypothetical protein